MSYKAVIFDLDGTTLNTIEDLKNAVNFALEKYGYPTRTLEEVTKFVGNGIRKLIERAVSEDAPKEEHDKVFEAFVAQYKEHMADCTKPYAGICELLSDLKSEGIKLAIASNKADSAVQILAEKYFNGIFDAVYGENENAGIGKKPSPDMVYKIIDDIGIAPKDILYVGDSDVDIETAKKSNLDFVCVTWGFRSAEFLKEHGATVLVDKPEELKKIVLG